MTPPHPIAEVRLATVGHAHDKEFHLDPPEEQIMPLKKINHPFVYGQMKPPGMANTFVIYPGCSIYNL